MFGPQRKSRYIPCRRARRGRRQPDCRDCLEQFGRWVQRVGAGGARPSKRVSCPRPAPIAARWMWRWMRMRTPTAASPSGCRIPPMPITAGWSLEAQVSPARSWLWPRWQSRTPCEVLPNRLLVRLCSPIYTRPRELTAYAANYREATKGKAGAWSAGTGWDYITGLGAPKAQDLLPYLVSQP